MARACSFARVGSSQVVKALPAWLCSPRGPCWCVTALSTGIRRSLKAAEVSTSFALGSDARCTQPA
jgi:hypothetical protein